MAVLDRDEYLFESSVNSEGIETIRTNSYSTDLFESSVNSEGIETYEECCGSANCLRAV